MANVTLYLENINGLLVEILADEDQELPCPLNVNETCKKRAGDFVVGEQIVHARALLTIVDPPE
jgi:hypothetical protein